jgi:SAM-dependent methyltransferase
VTAPLTIHGWLRYPIIRELLPRDVSSILEIGCGRGALGSILAREYRYVGLEPDKESFRFARSMVDSVLPLRADEYDPSEPFDLVCAFEVLEHIHEDEEALLAWSRYLRPGGWLLVSVPAGERRFGASDRRVGHFRRYERLALRDLLLRAGYVEPILVGYGFPLGNALRLVGNVLAGRPIRSREDATASSGRWLQPGARSAIVRRAIASPFALTQRLFAASDLSPLLIARARLP